MRKHRNTFAKPQPGLNHVTQLPNRAWRRADPTDALNYANWATMRLLGIAAALVGFLPIPEVDAA